MIRPFIVVGLLTVQAAVASASSPDVVAHRARLTLSDAPSQPPSVQGILTKVKARPEENGRRELTDVVVVGQIGGMPTFLI